MSQRNFTPIACMASQKWPFKYSTLCYFSLYVASTLLYSSHDNIIDCSIREYLSIVAIYNYVSTGLNQWLTVSYYTYKTAYLNHVDISTSFKNSRKNYTYLFS